MKLFSHTTICLILAITAQTLQAAPKTLAETKSVYNANIKKLEGTLKSEIVKLHKAHKTELDKRIASALKKGDIRSHDAIQAEKKKFINDKELPDNRKLDQLNEGKTRASLVLTKNYEGALKALQIKLTQAGDLDEARAIQAETARLAFIIAEAEADANAPQEAAKIEKPKSQWAGLDSHKDGMPNIVKLANGVKLYSNRNFAWQGVPEELDGFVLYQSVSGASNPSKFKVNTRGLAYLALMDDRRATPWAKNKGWKKTEMTITVVDSSGRQAGRMRIFSKSIWNFVNLPSNQDAHCLFIKHP